MPAEDIDLLSCFGRTLAEDIYASRNVPALNNSAMDGYAVRAADLWGASKEHHISLKLAGEIAAGTVVEAEAGAGQAMSIMTGAPVPRGADTIVPVEYAKENGEQVSIWLEPKTGDHIRQIGEDVKQGSLVLAKGQPLAAAQLGMLASLGQKRVNVAQRPRVAIVSTGNEIQEVGEEVSEHFVYKSNSYSLAAQVLDAGGEPLSLGIAPDDNQKLGQIIAATQDCQLLITTGGISMGKYDLVQEVLKTLGVELVFWKVAIKPGMPTLFGVWQGRLVFGLPGNPVACMITFEQFIRPAIYKLLGRDNIKPIYVNAILSESIKKKPGRVHLLRVTLNLKNGQYYASINGPQGTGILSSMLGADGLLMIPADRENVNEGEQLTVQLLPRSVTGFRNKLLE
jgi:molybdopterin molybdotransferase